MNGSDKRGLGTWAVACALLAVSTYPWVARQLARRAACDQLRRVERALKDGPRERLAFEPSLSISQRRLEGLLASWETIGGCGAGASTGGGGGLKWIGRSTTGGLFQLQTQASYLHLSDGYNLALSSQITRDLFDVWNVGVSVPLLYKYYRNYKGIMPAVDASNGGVGDVSVLLTRRLGEINDTSVTLALGLPTGTYDARFRNDMLSQEKQLGAGKLTGALTVDHTFDRQWGLMVLGASGAWRGGENKFGNYRAPQVSLYHHFGWYLGPWVPSVGLTVLYFFKPDRDRGDPQEQRLLSFAPSATLEWSTDWLAILGGFSIPYGFITPTKPGEGGKSTLNGPGFQPWTVAIGVSVSPF